MSSTAVNANTDDIIVMVAGSIAADGQTPITGNLQMNNYRHTGVSAGVSQTDYMRVDQVQKGTANLLTSVAGTSDVITATAAFSMTALVAGMRFIAVAASTSTTTTPTLNPNAIGAKTIKRGAGDALAIGDIVASTLMDLYFDGTDFILLNPATLSDDSVGTDQIVDGAVAFAKLDTSVYTTSATKLAGTDVDNSFTVDQSITRSSTNAKITVERTSTGAAEVVLTAENGQGAVGTESADEFMLRANGTDHWELHTTGSFTYEGGLSTGADTINALGYYKGGTALPVQEVFTSTDQTLTSAGALTIAHGLGVAPTMVLAFLICQSDDIGFTAGDVVPINQNFNSGGDLNCGQSIVIDSTNLNIRFGSSVGVYRLLHFTTGVRISITASNWKLRLKAFA